ncbi:MAG: hypothetical protein AAFV53_18810 [Myxococcota bacterium]
MERWLTALFAMGCSEFSVSPVAESDPLDEPAPLLEITPDRFDFDAQMVGCETWTIFTLKNIGDLPLELEDVSLGTDRPFTIRQPPALTTLQPDQQTSVVVSYRPDEETEYRDGLLVESNDPRGQQEALVFGTTDQTGACQDLRLQRRIKFETADVAFLLDTTYSMNALTEAVAEDLANIASDLQDEIEDITFGVASYRDYGENPFGRPDGDLPFRLEMQQTTALERVSGALSALVVDGGGDLPEAGAEALYQAATGQGYDLNCDGTLNPVADVPPFLSNGSDAFRGQAGGTYRVDVEGTGTVGGMGFREGVLPIVIIGTNDRLRDPGAGDDAPGGCTDATLADARAALDAINARLIGVVVNRPTSSEYTAQMQSVADTTVTWYPSSTAFRRLIVEAVRDQVTEVSFDRVWLTVKDDPLELIEEIVPLEWREVDYGEVVSFNLSTIDNAAIVNEPRPGETSEIILEMYGESGDQSWLLDTFTVYVLIPTP